MSRLTSGSRFEGMYKLNPSKGDIFDATYNVISKLGQLEDVLEEFDIKGVKELRNHLLFKENVTIWEGKLALENEIKELKLQLSKIVPKFKKGDIVYATYSENDIFKGYIDVFDYFNQQYLVFFNEDIGNDWFYEFELFKTEEEAQAKLDEIRRKK